MIDRLHLEIVRVSYSVYYHLTVEGEIKENITITLNPLTQTCMRLLDSLDSQCALMAVCSVSNFLQLIFHDITIKRKIIGKSNPDTS